MLWNGDKVVDLGNLGADFWNTPTAINERGDVEQGKDINDRGEITGRAVDLETGVRTAFRAVP